MITKGTRIFVAIFIMLALAVIAILVRRHSADVVKQQAAIQKGKYLVESVAICFECHSERDFSKPGWPIPLGRAGSGRILRGEGTENQVVAPNISTDNETGIGAWSDLQIKAAIRDGVGKDGRRLEAEMPYAYFKSLSDDELNSIVAYIRTIPPISNHLPSNRPVDPNRSSAATLAMDSIKLTSNSSQVQRGEFLVRIGGCETCHTPTTSAGFIKGLEFAGGTTFTHDKQVAASSNLTPSASGLSYYDGQRFLSVMRTGMVGSRPLNSAMPWLFYGKMSDEDLLSVFAYLRSLPPVDHKVDNTEPATFCRKCLNTHGLGNMN